MFPWWLRSEASKLRAVRGATGDKWAANVQRALRDKSSSLQEAAATEILRRGNAELPAEAVIIMAKRIQVSFNLLDWLPQLIAHASSKNQSVSESAHELLRQLRGKIPSGPDACPRCGSSSTTEGNATGWRCNGCGLVYKAHSGRNPSIFATTGGFRGGPPWKRAETVKLLEEVEQAKGVDDKPGIWWAGCRQRAQELLAERRELLRSLE